MRLRLFTATVLLVMTAGVLHAGATFSVMQRALELNTKSLTIAKGDRVVFQNGDDVIHNIHIFGSNDFDKDLGLQKPGVDLSYMFDKDGLFQVRCNIHPSVKMSINVK